LEREFNLTPCVQNTILFARLRLLNTANYGFEAQQPLRVITG
jgi:hypothetical protein